MKYQHPSIVIEEPAPGHYAIRGFAPASTFIEGEGHVVAPSTCYIPPTVPSDLLRAIIEDRDSGAPSHPGIPAAEQQPEAPVAGAPKKKAGRPSKKAEKAAAAAAAAEQQPEAPVAGAGGSEEGDEFE